MFCPTCGSEERQLSQFCRACGADLRVVRAGLERSDIVTDAATTARAEIGRAIADKVRELQKPGDLAKMAENVLPKIEKFLESPEEKRLRRMRDGVITSAVGLGVVFAFLIIALASNDPEFLIPSGGGLVTFFIGLGMLFNAKHFTLQKNLIADRSQEAALQNALDRLPSGATASPRELSAAQQQPPLSIVEHTTHRLSGEAEGARYGRASIGDEGRDV